MPDTDTASESRFNLDETMYDHSMVLPSSPVPSNNSLESDTSSASSQSQSNIGSVDLHPTMNGMFESARN
jgi:hypothetical protein